MLRANSAKLLRLLHSAHLSSNVSDLVVRLDDFSARYEFFQAVVSPTRFLASAYTKNGLSVPVYQMHFGVDMPQVAKSTVPPGAPLRFGFIGQLAPHKAPDLLVEAFCRLPKGSAVLHLFGSGDEKGEYVSGLRKRAEGYPVSFRGTFPSGQISNVFAGLDFLVIPSRWYENSPLVLLGALASHTPVVVSDVEGMAEFVEVGKNGFLFRRGSSENLERILKLLTEDPTASRRMSENTHYLRTTRKMTEDLITIYRSVLDGSLRAAAR